MRGCLRLERIELQKTKARTAFEQRRDALSTGDDADEVGDITCTEIDLPIRQLYGPQDLSTQAASISEAEPHWISSRTADYENLGAGLDKLRLAK